MIWMVVIWKHKERIKKIYTKQNTKIQPKKTVHEIVNFGSIKID